jgi:RecA/RadA recombinase
MAAKKIIKSSKKKSSKKKAKKKMGKKKEAKVKNDNGFDLSRLATSLKKFEVDITGTKKSGEDPYYIPFRHVGLNVNTGGIIGGTMFEISGDSMTGKSYLAYELMATVKAMGGISLLIDAENAYRPLYGKKYGIKKDVDFIYTKEKDLHEQMKLTYTFIKDSREQNKDKSIPILIIADSYMGTKLKASLEKMEKGGDPLGFIAMQKAAQYADELSTLDKYVNQYAATFGLINHAKPDKSVAVTKYQTRPLITNAEDALKFYFTQRIQGRTISQKKKEVVTLKSAKYKKKKIIGGVTLWTTIKNRLVDPFQTVEVEFNFSSGLKRLSGLAELLVNNEMIEQKKVSTKKKDGTKSKITKKVYKVLDPKEGLEKAHYETMKDLLKAYPEFKEPFLNDNYYEAGEEE